MAAPELVAIAASAASVPIGEVALDVALGVPAEIAASKGVAVLVTGEASEAEAAGVAEVLAGSIGAVAAIPGTVPEAEAAVASRVSIEPAAPGRSSVPQTSQTTLSDGFSLSHAGHLMVPALAPPASTPAAPAAGAAGAAAVASDSSSPHISQNCVPATLPWPHEGHFVI
jgi:hypothetical protein